MKRAPELYESGFSMMIYWVKLGVFWKILSIMKTTGQNVSEMAGFRVIFA
jgi:hypothetical protein